MPNAQSYDELVVKAEERAKTLADPAKLNFMQYMTSGGVVMPKTTDIDPLTGEPGEPIRIFLNAAVVKQMMTLADEADRLTTEHKAKHDAAHKDAKADRYAVLAAERDRARLEWFGEHKPEPVEDDDSSMLDEEPEPEQEDAPHFDTNEEIFERVEQEMPDYPPVTPPEVEKLVDRINELTREAFKNRFDIHLRGVLPSVVRDFNLAIEDELRKPDQQKLDPNERINYTNGRQADELIARSVMSIYNPMTGETDEFPEDEPMDALTAHAFLRMLPESQLRKLYEAAQGLSYTAVLLDLTTDAGFLGGHAEPESEPAVGVADQDSEDVG